MCQIPTKAKYTFNSGNSGNNNNIVKLPLKNNTFVHFHVYMNSLNNYYCNTFHLTMQFAVCICRERIFFQSQWLLVTRSVYRINYGYWLLPLYSCIGLLLVLWPSFSGFFFHVCLYRFITLVKCRKYTFTQKYDLGTCYLSIVTGPFALFIFNMFAFFHSTALIRRCVRVYNNQVHVFSPFRKK